MRRLVKDGGNTIVYGHDAGLREQGLRRLSTDPAPEGPTNCRSALRCCLRWISAPSSRGDRDVCRVRIVQFTDARSLNIRALKKSAS